MSNVTALVDATVETCGGKAGTLGLLRRQGFPVPDGFVVPFGAGPGPDLRRQVSTALAPWGDSPVAVRSSADSEDTAEASAAGQYASILAVQGVDAVLAAIENCWASTSSERVAAYRRTRRGGTRMAVLVQGLIDADVSGVMFTPDSPSRSTRIEATWGLGLAVVDGSVTPDSYEILPDRSIRRTIGTKLNRIDRTQNLAGLTTTPVSPPRQSAATLEDHTVRELATLGRRAAEFLQGPQDIEWAVHDQQIWLLQARPITAPLPPTVTAGSGPSSLLGAPGSHGVVTGTARIILGPSDFRRLHPGDILVCHHTDPAWTPLFTLAAGVVTEVGGVLSHAAIVAREYGLPAVLGVPRALDLIADGAQLTVDGTAGTVTTS